MAIEYKENCHVDQAVSHLPPEEQARYAHVKSIVKRWAEAQEQVNAIQKEMEALSTSKESPYEYTGHLAVDKDGMVTYGVALLHSYRNSPPVIFDARKTPTTDQN